MSDAFDPYREWLRIPPAEQPPHHYRLLGVGLYEDDADAIESAADQQMARLRTFQTGPHSALSPKLLNEVSQSLWRRGVRAGRIAGKSPPGAKRAARNRGKASGWDSLASNFSTES